MAWVASVVGPPHDDLMGTTRSVDDLERRPLHRSEYEALGRQGAFKDEKVELLDGQIVYAADEGSLHAAVCSRLNRILVEGVPASEGTVRVGNPFALTTSPNQNPTSSSLRRTPGPTGRGSRPRRRW